MVAVVRLDRRRTRAIRRRLEKCYGRPWGPSASDPVDMLVATILSQNTSDANSSAGFRRLRERFNSWGAVADARIEDIVDAIRPSGLGRTKAPRIRAILRQLRSVRGQIDLSHLATMTDDEALASLTAFPGVGPKTALCVLLFACGRDVFPVDTHIERIARRLGWLDQTVPAARAHETLTEAIAPEDRRLLHLLLIAHGRAVCKARSPRCESCVLLDWCPHGQEHLSG